MKILFIPLDERPCNYKYPVFLLKDQPEVQLFCPPARILSKIRKAADVDALWDFLESSLPQCDCAILSMDMLIYGGLIPSRLHQLPLDLLLERCDRLKKLKLNNPSIPFYGYSCIMRIPSYNGNMEEPLYYGDYGRRIFELSECMHKELLGISTQEDKVKHQHLLEEIPQEYREDYWNRREKNQAVTSHLLDFVKEGVFCQFILPQDDTSVYGIQVAEQQTHIEKINKLRLQNRVFIYPGADEVGLTLISKAVCDCRKTSPTVYIRYSSLTGPFVIPGFEDRPYEETIKWQLLSAGLTIVDNGQEADLIFMVNVPGREQISACNQHLNLRENCSGRNLLEFVRAAKYYLSKGKVVAVADVAYSNGGDLELLRLMELEGIQDRISSYAGWNTDGNTLGTAICFGVISLFFGLNRQFLFYRYLEDCGYQSFVRQELLKQLSSQESFASQAPMLKCKAMELLNHFQHEFLVSGFEDCHPLTGLEFPWNRLFEVDLHFEGGYQ